MPTLLHVYDVFYVSIAITCSNYLYSSLPFLFGCVRVLVGFFLLLWSSIYWCEQMWNP